MDLSTAKRDPAEKFDAKLHLEIALICSPSTALMVGTIVCVEKKLVIEIDGGYHDHIFEADAKRTEKMEAAGWNVVRFSNEDVIEDVDSVAVAIAQYLGLEPEFRSRKQ